MTFLLTLLLVGAAGLGLLDLLRLRTRSRLADAGLSWLVGCGFYAWAATVARLGLGIRYRAATVLVITLLPGAAALLRRRWRRPAVSSVMANLAGRLTASVAAPSGDPDWSRGVQPWWACVVPRPRGVWLPVAAYSVVVAILVGLHSIATPTHTDDAVRVRAFTPFLAAADEWPATARELLAQAGALPTFVPTVAWKLTGRFDHFHVNYTVLAHLAAFLALALGLGMAARRPQRGWATAFAIFSLPLFVYHLTSTYQDAVVALFGGAVLLFILEHARSRDSADAARGMLLAAALAMVKRDGLIVGGTLALVVVLELLLAMRKRAPAGAPTTEPVPVASKASSNVRGKRSSRARSATRRPARISASRGRGRQALVALAPSLYALVPTAIYMVCVVSAAGWSALFPTYPTPPAGATAPTPSAALPIFVEGLWLIGNAGMLYWVFPMALVVRCRHVRRAAFSFGLLGALLVFAETAATAIWLVPQWTIDQSTVHRALLSPSVLLAVWLAALLTEPQG